MGSPRRLLLVEIAFFKMIGSLVPAGIVISLGPAWVLGAREGVVVAGFADSWARETYDNASIAISTRIRTPPARLDAETALWKVRCVRFQQSSFKPLLSNKVALSLCYHATFASGGRHANDYFLALAGGCTSRECPECRKAAVGSDQAP